MIKVFIVDDEMLVRMGMKALIEWETYGMTICGEAANGQEALEKIRRLEPHIILTDLKMPIMDGLELIKCLKKQCFKGKIVVLSNYNDFEWVKEAMKHGACEYFLKVTLEAEALKQLLLSIVKELGQEEPEEKQTESFEEKTHKEIQLGQFLGELLNGEGLELMNTQGLCLGEYNRLILMEVSHERLDVTAFYATLQRIIAEIIARRGRGEVCHYKENQFLIVIQKLSEGEETLSLLCEEMKRMIKQYIDLDSFYIYDEKPIAVREMKERITLLAEQSSIHFYEETPAIKRSDDLMRLTKDIDKSFWEQKVRLKEAMEVYQEQVPILLGQLFEQIQMRQYTHQALSQVSRNLLTLLEEVVIKEEEKLHQVIEPPALAVSYKTFEEFKAQFVCLYERALEQMRQMRKSQLSPYVIQAMTYIGNHYTEKISLEDLAAEVNVNKNYFCKVFKEQLKISPLEYIIKYKMEEAKRILKSRQMNVSEVAAFMGYQDLSYFNRLFKKYEGISPGAYYKLLR